MHTSSLAVDRCSIANYYRHRRRRRNHYPHRETGIVIERIRKILAAGANVILTTQGIDDLCLKEFVEAGAMAVRRCKKEDLKRIAKATGATLVSSLANLEGDETFEASSLGLADEVAQVRVSDDELILIKGTKVVNSSSIVLRGANDYMLDEMERALHDSLSIIKRTLESGSVVPGGGAVEVALSIYLENFATTLVRACDRFPLLVLSFFRSASICGLDCVVMMCSFSAHLGIAFGMTRIMSICSGIQRL